MNIRRLSISVVLAAWAVLVSLVSADLLASHIITLPEPEPSAVERVVASVRKADEADRWIAVHVLDAECGCSKKIFDHLIGSKRPAGVIEKIILVGNDADREARAKGMEIVHVTRELLANVEGIEAVPLLIVADPAGHARYVGGYTDRKQGPVIKDTEVIVALERGEHPDVHPLFGCAVGENLRKTLDPLSLKYSDRK